MKRVFEIPCGMWCGSVWIVAGYPEKKAEQVFIKKILEPNGISSHTFSESKPISTASTWWSDYAKSVLIFFVEEHPDLRSIVHESIHAAWRILEHSGVVLDKEDHEALTYFSEYIFAGIHSVIYERPVPRKKALKKIKARSGRGK